MTPPEGATGVWKSGRDAGVIHEEAVEAGRLFVWRQREYSLISHYEVAAAETAHAERTFDYAIQNPAKSGT